MRGIYVHVKGPGLSEAFLQSWGRSSRGWYGLIAWEARVRLHGTSEKRTFAAWVPSERLSRPHYVPAERIGRSVLPANRLEWPAPQVVDVDYFLGVWDEGEVRLPAGVELDRTPAWRRR